MPKMNKNKCASLGFGKKWPHLFFGEIENENKNLPASSVFQKSGLRNTCLFVFSLMFFFIFLMVLQIAM